MKLRALFTMICAGLAFSTLAQEQIKWLNIEQAESLAKQDGSNAKKYLVDCYTDWCGWCKRMDRDTFSDTLIARIVDFYFYPVKFNTESIEPVTFNSKVYTNSATKSRRGSTHALAYFLLNNRLSYPSFSVLSSEGTLLTICPGYHEAAEFEVFLVFMGEEFYKQMNFETFSKDYHSKYRASVLSKIYSEK